MPNQRDIAKHLDISQATVARALQGSASVKPETRQRIEAAAKALGYLPNPMVTSLMEHIRSGRQPSDLGTIAILIDAESEEDYLLVGEAYKWQMEGYQMCAQQRGYRTELFYLRKAGITDESIDRILFSRGIQGVILAGPDRMQKTNFNLRWERYAIASVSYERSYLAIDRATADFRQNTAMAFQKLLDRGYQRIGLSLPPNAFNPADSSWLAGYLACQYYLPKMSRIPPFVGEASATASLDSFRKWNKQWRPDSLLCLQGEELKWLQLGISFQNEMALVCLNRPAESDYTGVTENNTLIGKLTCDIVINHIIHNVRGLSPHPSLISVKGDWIEGSTLPDRIS